MTNPQIRLGSPWARATEFGMFLLTPASYLALLCLMFCAFCAQGCSAAGSGRDVEIDVFQDTQTVTTTSDDARPTLPTQAASDIMRVVVTSADYSLDAAVTQALLVLNEHGFNVVEDVTGIPIELDPALYDSTNAVAQAHLSVGCYYAGCNDHARIRVDPGFFVRSDWLKGYGQNVLVHEMGHIISDLGACAPDSLKMAPDHMHLPEASGNIMSNGNNGFYKFELTADDMTLLNSCLNAFAN